MLILKVLAAGAVAGVLANATGYLITGRLFHRFQAMTPHTWRAAESWTHYLYAAALRIAASISIGFAYAAVQAALPFFGQDVFLRAGSFGSLLWAVTIMPLVLEAALFVNWRAGFVVGLLLDWLIVCVLASLSAALVVAAIHV